MPALSNGALLPSAWLSAPTLGPITFDSLYDGEVFNASLAAEWAGWDAPGFEAAALGWVPPAAATSPANNATVSSQRAEPIVVVQEVSAVSAWATGVGATAFDFGRYVTGVLRVSLPPLPAGTVVTLAHAEILAHEPYGPANGSIYTGTLRKGLVTSMWCTVSTSTPLHPRAQVTRTPPTTTSRVGTPRARPTRRRSRSTASATQSSQVSRSRHCPSRQPWHSRLTTTSRRGRALELGTPSSPR